MADDYEERVAEINAHKPDTLVGRIRHTNTPILTEGVLEQQEPWEEKKRAAGLGKPIGCWYAIDDAWWAWCAGEQFGDGVHKLNAYRLDIDMSNVLVLATEADILAFTDEYRTQPPWWDAAVAASTLPAPEFVHYIDWRRVAEKYTGCEINPYQFGLRLSNRCSWYYGWDVASGVVWDTSTIRNTTQIYRGRTSLEPQ